MRRRSILNVLWVGAVLAGSCSLPDYKYAPAPVFRCDDGERNGNETDIDCGGDLCERCPIGGSCRENRDCAIDSCVKSLCQAEHCVDTITNEGETDVGCGGTECPLCGVNQRCKLSTDCRSQVCSGLYCVANDCDNGVIDANETDLNCGGDTCPGCTFGKRCDTGSDCRDGYCGQGQCTTMACLNGNKDPGEEGVDCGGSCLNPCDEQVTCHDNDKTGRETDTDCGGPVCDRCPTGARCAQNLDCQTNRCVNDYCADAVCTGPDCEMGGAGGMGSGGAPETGGMGGDGGTSSGGVATGGVSPRGGAGSGGASGGSGGSSRGGASSGGTMNESGGAPTGGSSMGGSSMGGSSTGGGGPLPRCPGCAKLSVPLTAAGQKANFVIFLGGSTDLNNAKITYRLYVEAGSGGQVKGYIQHDSGRGIGSDYGQLFQRPAAPLTASGWMDLEWDVKAQDTTFNRSTIGRVGIQLTADGSTSWSNPSIVYIDSITVTGANAGPWSFDNPGSVDPNATISAPVGVMFTNSGDSPVSGSRIGWLGP